MFFYSQQFPFIYLFIYLFIHSFIHSSIASFRSISLFYFIQMKYQLIEIQVKSSFHSFMEFFAMLPPFHPALCHFCAHLKTHHTLPFQFLCLSSSMLAAASAASWPSLFLPLGFQHFFVYSTQKTDTLQEYSIYSILEHNAQNSVTVFS